MLGNFNCMPDLSDKKGGIPLTFNNCKEFINCIDECRLIAFNPSSPYFTYNHRDVYKRIDYVFSNFNWL